MDASMTRPRSSATALVAARAAIASRPATTAARVANTAAIPRMKGKTSPIDAVPATTGERAAEMSSAWAKTNSAVMVPRRAVTAMGIRADRA
jgi:hypothetical protein